MASTTQHEPASPSDPSLATALYVFTCRGCDFKTAEAKEARTHWQSTQHPYDAAPVSLRIARQIASILVRRRFPPAPVEAMPESPPADSLESKLELLIAVLSRAEELATEVSTEAEEDRRIRGTDAPAVVLHVALGANAERARMEELLHDLHVVDQAERQGVARG
jgi:hypothetical protein